jgi:hypothetical protein
MRRNFPAKAKRAALARAKGKCEKCGTPTGPGNPPEIHHAVSDWMGGKPVLENAIVLGRKCCHRFITAAEAAPRAKADRARKSFLAQKPKSSLAAPPKLRRPMERDEDAHLSRAGVKHAEHMRRMAGKGA